MSKEITGFDSWIKAASLLIFAASIRAAYLSFKKVESGEDKQTRLLQSIDAKLNILITGNPTPTAGIDYNEL
jgi:hypothetical protein